MPLAAVADPDFQQRTPDRLHRFDDPDALSLDLDQTHMAVRRVRGGFDGLSLRGAAGLKDQIPALPRMGQSEGQMA